MQKSKAVAAVKRFAGSMYRMGGLMMAVGGLLRYMVDNKKEDD